MVYQSVTLKVCEGCGTLWVRRGASGVYCGPCAELFREFPDPRTRLRPGRPKKVRPAGGPGGFGMPAALPMMPMAGGVQ